MFSSCSLENGIHSHSLNFGARQQTIYLYLNGIGNALFVYIGPCESGGKKLVLALRPN